MAVRTRNFNWSATELGDPESWSPTLTTAIAMCLASPAPVQLWWGRSLTLLYNDAAIRAVDEHPDALGRPVPELWTERWRTLQPDVERVFESRAAVHTGVMTLVPLFDVTGEVAGIACSLLATDDFLATVGHELRNPLATVSTTLQALQLRSPSREMDLMDRAVRHLTRLVDDLLESSRLSRGKVELQRKAVELALVVDRAMEMVTPLFDDKRSKVVVSVPRVGWRVEADRERLARALGNVLTNAAQYSPPETKIVVEVQRDGERIRLRIVDEGPGIAPEQLRGVFQSFQADRAPGSLGLGLAIARSLVELHGGTIAVRNAATGRGTECEIELAATSLPAAEVVTAHPDGTHRKRLLLVEDNDDTARALKTALEQLGYEVALAHNGPIAINLAKSFLPDVALLDLGLPVMDGWELAKRLRGAGDETPLVAVTARDQEADKRRSAEIGFAEHLVKPIDLVQLERIVDTLLGRRAKPDSPP